MTIVSIGAVASLLAAGLSGFATMQVADLESRMIQRSDRINAYSGLLVASEAYLSLYRQAPDCPFIANYSGPSPEAFELRGDVATAASRAILVGSSEGVAAAKEVDQQIADLHELLYTKSLQDGGEFLCRDIQPGFIRGEDYDLRDAETAVSNFLQVARSDVAPK